MTEKKELFEISGNLTADPSFEERSGEKGDFVVARFTILTNKEGEERPKATYCQVSSDSKAFEEAKNYKKGDFVWVKGDLDNWKTREGKDMTTLKVYATKNLRKSLKKEMTEISEKNQTKETKENTRKEQIEL